MDSAKPVFLVGRVLLCIGEALCRVKLKDSEAPVCHMCGLIADSLEQAMREQEMKGVGQGEESVVFSTHTHLLSLLAVLLNLDPVPETVR